MRVFIVTSFAIPHVGGASTHIELLASALAKRGVLGDLISRTMLRQPWWDHALYLPLRLLNKDRARVYRLEQMIDLLARNLRQHVPRGGNLVLHCHDPLATCAALRTKIEHAAIVQTVHGPWSRENQTHGAGATSAYNQAAQRFEREAFAGAHRLVASTLR